MPEYKVTTISVEKEIPEDIKRAGRRFFYDFTLNIKVAYELGLDRLGFDHDDLIILQAIGKMMASDSFAKTEIPGMNGKWIWIAHQKLLDECPFLRIKKDMLKKRLADMEKHGLIRRHLKDFTMPMYQPGEHFDKLVYGRGRESITGGVGNSLPGGRESITDNDSYSYDLNSYDNIESDLGKSSSPNANLDQAKEEDFTRSAERAKSLWNEFSGHGIPPIRTMTRKRAQGLSRRVLEGMDLSQVLGKAKMSDFLTGKNDRGWKMTLDWLIENDTNWVKVMEGKYDNRPSVSSVRAADREIYK